MKKWGKQDHRLLVLLAWVFLVVAYLWFPDTPAIQGSGPADTMSILEVDGINQSGRPVWFGREFRDADITAGDYPQPQITGQSITSWQANCFNFYASGSPKYCFIAYIQPSMTAGSSDVISSFASNANSCSSCTGGTPAGYLSATSMANFNVGGGAGVWDAKIAVAAAGSTTVTTSLKTMLAASDPGTNTYGDCKNDYWVRGPVITAVIVQDCTSTSASDFGWSWNGTTMSTPVTGNSTTATNHPMGILWFVPSINAIYAEEIIETPWWNRWQDQLENLTFQTSDNTGTLQTRWTQTGARKLTDVTSSTTAHDAPLLSTSTLTSASGNFQTSDVGDSICLLHDGSFYTCGTISARASTTQITMRFPVEAGVITDSTNMTVYINDRAAGTRARKSFWVGAAPGHIRIGHNFAYLISTKAIPNYDQSVTSNPEHGYYPVGSVKCCAAWAYTDWVAAGDLGDIAQYSGQQSSWAAVVEGRPLSVETHRYLSNMDSGSCINANSACAKAWDMLTGEVDANASTTLTGVAGGGGFWYVFGNNPIHARESHTAATGGNQTSGNCLYVSAFEHKNAVGNATATSCTGAGDGLIADPTGPNNATGHALSRHAHSDTGLHDTPIGSTISPDGGWDVGEMTLHSIDDNDYVAYLLTGDPYYLEDLYMIASYNIMTFQTPTDTVSYSSNNFFGYLNPGGALLRGMAWGLQSVMRAAYIAVDGSAEQAYYKSIVNSNEEVQEGVMNLTGTTLTPTSPAPTCGGASCSYNVTSSTRWDWGAATVRSTCVNTSTATCTIIAQAMHQAAPGECLDLTGGGATNGMNDIKALIFLGAGAFSPGYATGDVVANPNGGPSGVYFVSLVNNNTAATSNATDWASTSSNSVIQVSAAGGMGYQYSFLTIVFGEMQEMGFPVAAVSDDLLKSYVERALDSNYNPYLIQEAYLPTKDIAGRTACGAGGGGENSDPYLNTYIKLKNGTQNSESGATTFDASATPLYTNFACSDRGYSLLARAALSFAQEFNITSTDSGTSATLTAASAWMWANGHIPYLANTPAGSTSCTTLDPYGAANDQQVKFAIAPVGGGGGGGGGTGSQPVPAPIIGMEDLRWGRK